MSVNTWCKSLQWTLSWGRSNTNTTDSGTHITRITSWQKRHNLVLTQGCTMDRVCGCYICWLSENLRSRFILDQCWYRFKGAVCYMKFAKLSKKTCTQNENRVNWLPQWCISISCLLTNHFCSNVKWDSCDFKTKSFFGLRMLRKKTDVMLLWGPKSCVFPWMYLCLLNSPTLLQPVNSQQGHILLWPERDFWLLLSEELRPLWKKTKQKTLKLNNHRIVWI